MNADHEEAVEFAKISKRENRVYVGNLSYDVKYRDLLEFMRGGGWRPEFFPSYFGLVWRGAVPLAGWLCGCGGVQWMRGAKSGSSSRLYPPFLDFLRFFHMEWVSGLDC